MRPRSALAVAIRLLPVAFLLLLTTACVSKGDHEALQAELAACEQARAEAQAQVLSWESRYDREAQRWENVEASVADAVPRALSEIHEERERIVALVPDQVRGEVTSYLDEYFNTVMTGFDRLAEDSQDLKIELLATNKALEALGQDTRSINTAISESLSDEKGRRDQLSSDLADLIDLIVEYDQTRLNCKGCPERLRMRDKSRQALLAFHQDLMNDLSRLQTFATSPAGTPLEEAGGEEPDEAPEVGSEGEAEAADES
ncbi:MAG: hypothetical protein MI919_31000 [Holophagales bacterium]|nr:hypothetical protein [Holophagales bacterium]